jgi:hypothetical protein
MVERRFDKVVALTRQWQPNPYRTSLDQVKIYQTVEKGINMNQADFWALVNQTNRSSNGDMDTQLQRMIDRLAELAREEIIDCERIILELVRLSFRADLWDACNIMTCEPSESVFAEFQGWLIAQGQAIYEDALDNPETLADSVNVNDRENIIDGRLRDVASEAYYRKLGEDIPLVGYSQPLVLLGEHTDRQEFSTRYPQLFAKYGNCEDE